MRWKLPLIGDLDLQAMCAEVRVRAAERPVAAQRLPSTIARRGTGSRD